MACKGLANCAVIGVPHPKWHERPLLVAVKAPGAEPTKAEILDVLASKLAKWQLPDDVVFVDALPHDGDRQDLQEGPAGEVRGLQAAGVEHHPSSRPERCEPKASSAPSRDLVSVAQVPDSLACGSASGMTGGVAFKFLKCFVR